MTQTAPGPAGTTVRHPLAPLTVAEAGAACRLALAAGFGPGTRLVYCALDEPPKEAVLGWDGRAGCCLRHRRSPSWRTCNEDTFVMVRPYQHQATGRLTARQRRRGRGPRRRQAAP